MVRRCCIVTCRNGGTNCDERVSYFKVPSDEGLFEKWTAAVVHTGSTLYKSSAICERHFKPGEIRRESLLKDSSGNVIFQRPLTKFALCRDAIPSIFHEDVDQATGKKRRKRRATDVNDGNLIGNLENQKYKYGNIVVTFKQGFSIPNDAKQLQIESTFNDKERNSENNLDNINGTLNTAIYYVNGGTYNNNSITCIGTTYHDINGQEKAGSNPEGPGTTKSIESQCRAQEDGNSLSNLENCDSNEILHSTDSETLNKEQLSDNIPNETLNISESNLEAPTEVTIMVPEEEILLLNQNNNFSNPRKRKRAPKSSKPAVATLLPESNIEINRQAFDLIFLNSDKIKLPNPMWGFHKNVIDKDIIIFSKALWFKSDVLIPPIYQKQVIFHKSDDIKIYINNKFSPLEVRRPKDVEEMEQILRSVDEISVCVGGPSIGECGTGHCAQKDYAVSRWRHKLCPIVVPNGETKCKFCATINQVLRYPKKKRLPFGRRPAVEQES